METLICPYVAGQISTNCTVYNTWRPVGKSSNIDIIEKRHSVRPSERYSCVALEQQRNKTPLLSKKDAKCSHLEILNNSSR